MSFSEFPVVRLTNNPLKVSNLRAEGVPVVRRMPVEIEPNEHSRGYLIAKARRMGHQLDLAQLVSHGEPLPILPTEHADGEPISKDDTAVRALLAKDR